MQKKGEGGAKSKYASKVLSRVQFLRYLKGANKKEKLNRRKRGRAGPKSKHASQVLSWAQFLSFLKGTNKKKT